MTDNDCFVERESLDPRHDHQIGRFAFASTTRGTDPQMKGFKNSSISNTRSATYVALTSFLDPEIPRNEGTYRCVEVDAPLGSVVNPRPPAPVTMCTVLPAHEIIHACWMALAKAAPERACAGWGKISHCNMAGADPSRAAPTSCTIGAPCQRPAPCSGRDGFEQIGPLNSLGKLIVPNCETYEQLYPVRFVQHELRCDAAGPGKFRGGTGAAYHVLVEAEAEYAFRGEGQRTPSGYGVHGGGMGAAGSRRVHQADGKRVDSAAVRRRPPRPDRDQDPLARRAAAGAIRRSAAPSACCATCATAL